MAKSKSKKRKMNTSPGQSQYQSQNQSQDQMIPDPVSTNCASCSEEIKVDDGSSPFKCSICDSCYHDDCLDYDSNTAELLHSIVEVIRWVCEPCITAARNGHAASSKPNTAAKKLQCEVLELMSTCYNIHRDLALETVIPRNELFPTLPTLPTQSATPSFSSTNTTQSYAGVVSADTARPALSLVQRPNLSSGTDAGAMLLTFHREVQDKERRARNVIVNGLVPQSDVKDIILFRRLCHEELSIDISDQMVENRCRRIGKPATGKVLPLLVSFSSPRIATNVLESAKSLRNSSDQYISSSIYINADLTRVEAQLAFERRQQRRNKRETSSQLNHVYYQSASTSAMPSSSTYGGHMVAPTKSQEPVNPPVMLGPDHNMFLHFPSQGDAAVVDESAATIPD